MKKSAPVACATCSGALLMNVRRSRASSRAIVGITKPRQGSAVTNRSALDGTTEESRFACGYHRRQSINPYRSSYRRRRHAKIIVMSQDCHASALARVRKVFWRSQCASEPTTHPSLQACANAAVSNTPLLNPEFV